MNIIDAFGEQFTDAIEGAGPIRSMEGDEVHDDFTDYVSSNCGCWECTLNTQGIFETVFFYPNPNCLLPFGIKSNMSLADVVALFGSPSKRGNAFNDEILGKIGNWVRFDQADRSIHVEFDYDGNYVKQVTLMLPDIAP